MTVSGGGELVRGLPVPAGLRTAEIDGTSLAYVEAGSGDPVVFVHGSISDLTAWTPQLPSIGARHRAVVYSRRYAWPNVDLPASHPDTMDVHVSDLLAFLRAIDAYPAHLVGNSWGAFVALVVAIREPAAVRSLVLEEPPLIPLIAGNPPPVPAQLVRSMLRRPRVTIAGLRFAATTLNPVRKMADSGDVNGSVERFARAVLGDSGYARLPDDFRRHMLANSSTHVGQIRADGGFADIDDEQIRAVHTPALVVSGAESPPMFRGIVDLLASLLPNCERFTVPAASHAMHLENPDVFNSALLQFLAQH